MNTSATPAGASPRIGEWLQRRGLCSAAEVEQALALQARQGGRLGSILVRLGALSEDSLYLGLAEQRGLRLLEANQLDAAEIEAGIGRSGRSRAWWLRQHALPWFDVQGQWHVAAVDPFAGDLRETLAGDALRDAQWCLVTPAVFDRLTAGLRSGGADGAPDERSLRELAEDAPVIAYVNNIFAQAMDARASDIHLEPGEREFTVRMRVDGVLHVRQAQSMARFAAIASRIKLIAGLDIAERRLPQDGRTSLRVSGVQVDVRVSAIPAVHGESLVLRLLPKERADLGLDRLGMADDHLSMFRHWLDWPNGLILVTGPTGSGKSTTLYSALAAINDLSRKIVTVEDPVEFRLPDVVQIQTQAEIGYTFARALRSILRHDPDIIMIGEIRDRETAEIAIQSALTGHLVLATLHTNDALSAVTRLIDMGIEPYMVAAALRAVMAQRLVRRLCPSCAQAVVPAPALAERWSEVRGRFPSAGGEAATPRWLHAGGCPQCQSTGFRGRSGIYELVPVSTEMQHEIARGAAPALVTALADRAGRRSLADDGLLKAAQGMSTYDEVLRACGGLVVD
jgi:general secretion pathway protein E